MNWLSNFIRPRIRSFVSQKDVPENLWQKCPSCDGMLFNAELKKNFNVCYHCGHHLRIPSELRMRLLFDDGHYDTVALPKFPHDPLKFKDKKRYVDRHRDAVSKTGKQDAITIAKGTIKGFPVICAVFNFSFMGGSMGTAVGEGLVKAAETAVKEKAALIAIPSSGGARMQEGALSLMQMPRSVIAVQMVREAGLPYFVIFTDPTYGGVTASFAMLGDIHIAEPGAKIGFAGPDVIRNTVREELPDGFQTAEYLYDHGMIDIVVPRTEIPKRIGSLLGLLMQPEKEPDNRTGKTNKKSTKKEESDKNDTQQSSPKSSSSSARNQSVISLAEAKKARVQKRTQKSQKTQAVRTKEQKSANNG